MEQNNGKVFAIISFVAGILGVLGTCCWGLGFLPGIVAVITSIISLKKKEDMKWMAITGVICGGIAVVVGFIVFLSMGVGVLAPSLVRYIDMAG